MTSALVPAGFETAGPLETTALRRARASVLSALSRLLLPWMQRLARDRVGGETIDDAMYVAANLATQRMASTLGFWDTAEYSGRQVMDIYVSVVERVARSGLDGSVSIKPPAIRFDSQWAAELAAAAASAQVRLHCDSHAHDTVEASQGIEQAMLRALPSGSLGTTLPGRWSRSLSDADRALDLGLGVRVVKGQWPDPREPRRDLREGFLAVIDRLAGRARHVGVATHDVPLAAEAVSRLRAAGTPCELELLFGRPQALALRWADENAVAVRAYVPFGKGYIPSAVGILARNPRLAVRMMSSFLAESVSRLVGNGGESFSLRRPRARRRRRSRPTAAT
jgi:proline dehydrogenase